MGKDLQGKELGHGIIQKRNGRYEARYYNRFGKRVSISDKNLKQLKKKYKEALYEDERELNIRGEICLDDWYEKWMTIYKYDVIRDNSRRHYNQVYKKHISPYLGHLKIHEITQLQIRELIKKLGKNGYRYETKNKVKIMLVDMFNKAMIDEFVRRNPARGITVKRDEKKEVRVLSVDEQIVFFDCCKGTFYDNLFNVAICTGMRIGELAALRWMDIDWKKRVINVNRTLVYQKYDEDDAKTFHFELPKTKTSIRQIPISKQCEYYLRKQYLQKNIVMGKTPKKVGDQFKDLLFSTKYGTPLNSQIVCDAIGRIVDEINLVRDFTEEMEMFSAHCFRHTFATRCFDAGIQPKTVQAYLGHASLQMTMDLYTSVLGEYKSSEMTKLETVFDNIDEKAEQMYNFYMHTGDNRKVVNLGDY